MIPEPNPFQKPTTPKNGLELVKWAIFEPVVLENFSKSLSKKQVIIWLLRAYAWIVLIAIILYLITTCIVVLADFPALFPSAYKPEFLAEWQNINGFERYYFLLKFGAVGLVFSLVFGLLFSLALSLLFNLSEDLSWSLAFALAFSLALSLSFSLARGISDNLVFSLSGLVAGLAVGLAFSLAGSLVFTLAIGLVGGIAGGVTGGGLAFITSFYFSYFRLLFYPYYVLKLFSNVDFYHNPYLHDGVIWLPLPTVKDKLTRLAAQQPDIALKFVDFLLEYRPLQRKLAMHLLHAATAGQWAHSPLDADRLLPPNVAKEMPTFNPKPELVKLPLVRLPHVAKTTLTFTPSDDWISQLTALKNQLISSQLQSNIGLRKTHFEQFYNTLKAFRSLTLRESPLWNRYYLDALDQWLTVAQEELNRLTTESQTREPISSNRYRPGEALDPDTANVFFGRKDLRDNLARKILTSLNMPLFLIQGQRRVGKTSLLNFLPQLLGNRFKIIYQDCQDDRVNGIIPWLQDCHRRLQAQLNLPVTVWQPPADWLTAWGEFKHYLTTLSLDKNCKLILAFDEYERLHRFFQENVTQAEDLLAAMRSFSQHQNQVVFLFVGANLFSELQRPNWSKYFVQVERLKVDYLKKSEALQLITEPVQLIYPPEIPEQMFELTQGHPALLQKLCYQMVDIANADLRKQMTHHDLAKAIHATLDRENLAIGVFWTEFCESPDCKKTIKQILAQQPPTDQYHLLRLAEHGYIIQENGLWQLRVPLFQQWLENYAEAFR